MAVLLGVFASALGVVILFVVAWKTREFFPSDFDNLRGGAESSPLFENRVRTIVQDEIKRHGATGSGANPLPPIKGVHAARPEAPPQRVDDERISHLENRIGNLELAYQRLKISTAGTAAPSSAPPATRTPGQRNDQPSTIQPSRMGGGQPWPIYQDEGQAENVVRHSTPPEAPRSRNWDQSALLAFWNDPGNRKQLFNQEWLRQNASGHGWLFFSIGLPGVGLTAWCREEVSPGPVDMLILVAPGVNYRGVKQIFDTANDSGDVVCRVLHPATARLEYETFKELREDRLENAGRIDWIVSVKQSSGLVELD